MLDVAILPDPPKRFRVTVTNDAGVSVYVDLTPEELDDFCRRGIDKAGIRPSRENRR